MTLQIEEPRTKRWTLDEYYRLAHDGWFRDQRVQLIGGELIQMPPQGHQHAKAIIRAMKWLNRVFGEEYVVRCQMPLNVPDHSDPEPDLAVIPGNIEIMTDHPQSALLVIEISDSSLNLDRRKSSLYAAANVAEYWIVNLAQQCVEIHRDRKQDAEAEFGASYDTTVIAKAHDTISPIGLSNAEIKVSDLLN